MPDEAPFTQEEMLGISAASRLAYALPPKTEDFLAGVLEELYGPAEVDQPAEKEKL